MKTPKRQPGRPPEGRVKVTIHVRPATLRAIRKRVAKDANTLGKVIDAEFAAGGQSEASA